MSKPHTDSSIIEHHEDGSWTETTVVTHLPATKAQKAVAATGLVAICVGPFVPLLLLAAADKLEARRERKAEKKNSPEND